VERLGWGMNVLHPKTKRGQVQSRMERASSPPPFH